MEFLIIGLFLLTIYFIPTFIAFYRRHTYKWVILGINTFAIAAGVPWLAALFGQFPNNKSLIDPTQATSQVRGLGILVLRIHRIRKRKRLFGRKE